MATEIEELCAKATPRPWKLLDMQCIGGISPVLCYDLGDIGGQVASFACTENMRPNADFALHAVNNIERLTADNEALREALAQAIEWDGYDSEGVAAVWLPKARAALSEKGKGL